MNFLADHMLGKLAKYLRMLGYDTVYPPPRLERLLADSELDPGSGPAQEND